MDLLKYLKYKIRSKNEVSSDLESLWLSIFVQDPKFWQVLKFINWGGSIIYVRQPTFVGFPFSFVVE